VPAYPKDRLDASESPGRGTGGERQRQIPKSAKAESSDGAGPRTLSRKGERTRETLLDAARREFERSGFLDARVADIVIEAGVSHGTFYTYFDSKGDVFREVAERVVDEMYQALDASVSDAKAPDLIRAANQVFVEVYQRHAAIFALIEQVATFDDYFREMRLEIRRKLVRRVERAIARMVDMGEAELGRLDRHSLAGALAGMVDNFAYMWFVLEEPTDRDAALETLDELWARALLVKPTKAAKPAKKAKNAPKAKKPTRPRTKR
jgi:AcrR family transcriptional regulator